jgi:hypothetical protein
MNCGTCKNWNLKDSRLRAHGYGQCKADPDEALRAGRTFSEWNPCRLGKYVKAPVAVIARRERELSPQEPEEATTE